MGKMCGAANTVKEAEGGIIWLDCSFKRSLRRTTFCACSHGWISQICSPTALARETSPSHTGSLLTGLLRTSGSAQSMSGRKRSEGILPQDLVLG